MAETQTTKPTTPATTKGPRKFLVQTGRYTIDGTFHHNNGFNGERAGLGFREGECVTDDAIRAHACLELGYRVLVAGTQDDAWPKREPEKGDEAAGSGRAGGTAKK
jgi:hypothetical protein